MGRKISHRTKADRRAKLYDVAQTRGIRAAQDILGSGCDPRLNYAHSQREFTELCEMLHALERRGREASSRRTF
jgi:hypothetical protein